MMWQQRLTVKDLGLKGWHEIPFYSQMIWALGQNIKRFRPSILVECQRSTQIWFQLCESAKISEYGKWVEWQKKGRWVRDTYKKSKKYLSL
jgi:hypothetical protein